MTANENIVISGMAVEAPGGIDSQELFFEALSQGYELLQPFPRDRDWEIAQVLSLGSLEGWGRVVDRGGFIDGAAEFDPGFFGISPREALGIDPQQRVALKIAWRAIENAGINPGEIRGTEVGVFIGASAMEYGPRVATVTDFSGLRVSGTAMGAIAGRISHSLQLNGPSLTVDTACASSLTALNLAVNAIKNGECEWAMAGGVCVMGSPGAFFEFAKNNALATDGHCKPFSADATGTVWGEGAGIVIVESESRARALGHRIYGTVLAVRTNHNGGGAHIMVPQVQAQRQLFTQTLAAAKINSAEITYLEGHGTGTPVGDPLELLALDEVYGQCSKREQEVLLGSVKSNIGHTQAASGILGLIKVLLCGRYETRVPTLHSAKPSTKIDWEKSGMTLCSKATPWESNLKRYAAVSSFGVAGSNAHAIVQLP